jgi:replicative DNA helicase
MGSEGVTQEMLIHNYTRLRDSKIEWTQPEDEAIFKYISTYFITHFELPTLVTVRDYFGPSGTNDTEAFERLKDIESAKHYVRTGFASLLTHLLENQNRFKAEALVKICGEIITKGLMIEEGREKVKKQGVRDGLLYFQEKALQLILPERSDRHDGDIRRDGQEVWNEYITAKLNKDKSWGKATGLEKIDVVCHGLKKGELHLHAAYAGELKSTFAMNWCYNLVTRYRTNVFYASFEMKYSHIRRLLYTIHSAHARWPLLGFPKPLDYRKVRDGELSPEEEAFYQLVIEDFTTNPEYCEFHVWEPDDDVSMDDARFKAELLNKQTEIGFVVLDHGGLMEPRKKKKNNNYTIELNSVIRDAKRFALHFDHGNGIPVLMLFQINRQGKIEAEKNEGIYRMNALAYANEAERSADVVTATYLDDALRREGQTKFCNPKNRDNPQFEPFNAQVEFLCRRMRNLDTDSDCGMNVQEGDEIATILGP